MDEERKKTYERLSRNAEDLRKTLGSADFNLAEADRLFRERNSLFYQLKDVFISDNIDNEEMDLIKCMIDDNNEILNLIELRKKEMEKTFRKKETDAKKITSYLKG